MLWAKKNSYKEFDDEKKFLRLENSPLPPPITFLMVSPLLYSDDTHWLQWYKQKSGNGGMKYKTLPLITFESCQRCGEDDLKQTAKPF